MSPGGSQGEWGGEGGVTRTKKKNCINRGREDQLEFVELRRGHLGGGDLVLGGWKTWCKPKSFTEVRGTKDRGRGVELVWSRKGGVIVHFGGGLREGIEKRKNQEEKRGGAKGSERVSEKCLSLL